MPSFSRTPRRVIRYFIDENVQSRYLVQHLRGGGLSVVTVGELGLQGYADAVWIPQVTTLGLVIITGDKWLRLVTAEKLAIKRAGARVIAVSLGGSKSMEAVAQNILNSRNALERFAKRNAAPWYVSLSMPTPKDFALNRSGKIREVGL